MLFSGNKFRLTPQTNELKFVFENLYLDNSTGVAEIGFSGVGNVLKFNFKDGTIFSPRGKKIYSYNVNQPLSLSGLVATGSYRYLINDVLIESSVSRSDFPIQRWFINTTGCNLAANVSLFTDDIPTDLRVDSSFKAFSGVNGSFINNSIHRVKVFDSTIFSYQSESDFFSGQITGQVDESGTLDFGLTDLDSGRFDATMSFYLTLNTSLGDISRLFTVERVSGLSDIVRTLTANTDDKEIGIEWFGTGLRNQFVYAPPTNQGEYFTYAAFAESLSGVYQDQVLDVQFEPYNPMQSGSYYAEYLTGIQFTSSGEYQSGKCPEVRFSGYYRVTGWDLNDNSLLLGSGCTGNIPVTFQRFGIYGTGASGYLAVKKIRLSGVYVAGINDFYIPNGFYLYSGGTGYTQAPRAILNTGVYANCYDAPLKFASNIASYEPFDTTLATLEPLADYLTGECMCGTGVLGNGTTGFKVTGVLITNDGSGYNQNFFPRMSFIRQAGDVFTKNATGVGLIKQSGQYIFANHWSIKTGISSYSLAEFKTPTLPYTGKIYLNSNQNFLTVQVNYSGLDNTQPVIAKFSVTNQDGSGVYNLVSGVKTYDITTGHLKKKNLDSLLFFQPQNQLSFLLTEDELDSLYSSDAYSNNTAIDLGDLDF